MKAGRYFRGFLLTTALTVLSGLAQAKYQVPKDHPLDLPPDATSADYQAALNSARMHGFEFTSDGLDDVIAAGEQNLNWIQAINSKRDANNQLSFTGAQYRHSYPIDKPNFYNPTIILNDYSQFLQASPAVFKSVVTSAQKPPTALPQGMTEDDYLAQGRALNLIYQSAIRWRLLAPNLDEYATYASGDVRGYYFLSNMQDRDQKLRSYQSLSQADQKQIGEWLVEMCVNAQNTRGFCQPALENSVEKGLGSALEYYNTYVATAKQVYNSYFQIPDYGKRTDVVWTDADDNLATIPFTEPGNAQLHQFMLNVEDEWHWQDWHLRLNFVATSSPDIPHLEFQPGTLPHVNKLGGNVITMDASTPLTDWDANWAIRHEFGHVLGFPDCYVEFYDSANKVMVNYQLDVTNLMCSRAGDFKQTHYDELKRVYYKTTSAASLR